MCCFLFVFSLTFRIPAEKGGRDERDPRCYYNETSLTHLSGTLLWTSEREFVFFSFFENEYKPVFFRANYVLLKPPLSVSHLNEPFPPSWMEISPLAFTCSALAPALSLSSSSLREHPSQHMAALLSVSGMSYFLPRPRCKKCTACADCAGGLTFIIWGVYNLVRGQ